MFKNNCIKLLISCIFASSLISLSSCEKMLETKPVGSISTDNAYDSEKNIEASLKGIYYKLQQSGNFYSGAYYSTFSLLSDEAKLTTTTNVYTNEFATNEISTANTTAGLLWTACYEVIYQSNSLIENVTGKTDIDPVKRDQYLGEAKWLRAYAYFMLVQYYGDVPLATGTDYRVNNQLPRTSEAEINTFISKELEEAEKMLTDGYTLFNNQRSRITKQAAEALSARQYLYLKNWQKAEEKSTLLINSSLFSLPANPADVLKSNASGTIFELWFGEDGSPGNFTAQLLVPLATENAPLPTILPSDKLVDAFEPGDLRKSAYLKYHPEGDSGYYYVNKYSDRILLTDRPKLFRLAEQYLIRAEARAQLGENGAAADINVIRKRAGLPPTKASTKSELLEAIAQERFVEFCFEGDRWPDLKRTGKIDSIMHMYKPDSWQITDQLLPVPATELGTNPNLNPQNPGYNN